MPKLLKLSDPGFCEGCRENFLKHDITAKRPEEFQQISSITDLNQDLQKEPLEIPVKKPKCRFRANCTYDFLEGARLTKKGKPITTYHIVSIDDLKKKVGKAVHFEQA